MGPGHTKPPLGTIAGLMEAVTGASVDEAVGTKSIGWPVPSSSHAARANAAASTKTARPIFVMEPEPVSSRLTRISASRANVLKQPRTPEPHQLRVHTTALL